MSPAARVPLADLINAGALERVPLDAEICRNLLRQAGNHLRTAAGGVEGDPEGAFTLAYDSCRKASLALVMATGLRPKGDAEHRTTFEAAASIADTFGSRALVGDAADLRHVRHGAEHRGEVVTLSEAREATEIGLSSSPH